MLVTNTVEMMYRQMNEELMGIGLVDELGQPVKAEDIVEVIDGYRAPPTQEDIGNNSYIKREGTYTISCNTTNNRIIQCMCPYSHQHVGAQLCCAFAFQEFMYKL